MGRSGRIFFNGDDLQSAEVAALRRMLQSGSAGTVTVRSRRIDGSAFWNELSIAPVLDSNDRVTHFVSVLKDVSERTSEELSGQAEQLQQSVAFFKTGESEVKVSSRHAPLGAPRRPTVARLTAVLNTRDTGNNFKPF